MILSVGETSLGRRHQTIISCPFFKLVFCACAVPLAVGILFIFPPLSVSRCLAVTASDTLLMFSQHCAQLFHPHFGRLPAKSSSSLYVAVWQPYPALFFRPLYHDWSLAEVAVMKECKQMRKCKPVICNDYAFKLL